ncbi:MAG: DUF4350 domain-containing protein [Actinobacteria bacterium]|nr:DUF4350 domain-containing protein [Actinomycetota bacterium]
MSVGTRWTGLPPWARWVTGIVGAVVALNVVLTLLGGAYGAPEGKPSSSYATAPQGTAAVAELLSRRGHRVVPLRGSLSEELPRRGVLVVLDPETILTDEVRTLRAWVERGGTLVIGGNPHLWADELLETEVQWSPAGILDARPLADVPEVAAVGSIGGEGFGTWEDSGGALPVLGLESNPARTLVSIATIGSGRAVLIADTSVLHNRFLANADNAVFALNLAGPAGTPVYFAEGVHGYDNTTGLMAIPLRWKVVLIGLALASIVWMVAVGRRLGPPEPEARDLAPPRRAYVEALATTLARTRRPDEVVAPVRAAARSRIARRTGLDEGSDTALEGAGRALGLTDDEVAAVFGRRSDPVAVGRALAKLGGTKW